MRSGEESILQGDYGETWLRAVAAASGLLHGRPTTLDLEKADVELVRTGFWNGAWNPTVKVQVKTTVDLREENGHFIYDLDVATYEVLRRDNETVRRILVVFRLPKVGEKVRLLKTARCWRGAVRGLRLRGTHPPRTNSARS
jgi:hypothetical protein